jgi:hypothetical protein
MAILRKRPQEGEYWEAYRSFPSQYAFFFEREKLDLFLKIQFSSYPYKWKVTHFSETGTTLEMRYYTRKDFPREENKETENSNILDFFMNERD